LIAEQLAEQKENMLRFYTESLPYLNAQLVYEELLVKIDEARFKRSSIQYQFAMMMNPPQEEATDLDDDINTPPPVERKLKRN
jgi:hypothetical protein